MLAVRWRVGAMFAVLAAAAVCFSLQPAGIVTAEDKNPQSSVKEEASADQETTADEKPASGKTKTSDAKSKKKSGKRAIQKKSNSKSGRQPATGGQRPTQGTGGLVGSGTPNGAGGNAGAGGNSGGGFAAGGGAGNAGGPNAGQAGGTQNAVIPDPKEVLRVMAVQDKHTETLLTQEGIVGTATGISKDGKVFVKVYTSGAGKPVIPSKLDGIEVRSVLSGLIRPLSGSSGSPAYDPQLRAERPIPIGVSAFNEISPACGGSSCFAGTLGCRLKAQNGSAYFALSNNHVFANENAATIGNTIVQPSPGDNNCECAPDDVVGQLYKFKPIVFLGNGDNLMDAAVMSTTRQQVSNRTLPDGYGMPRSTTVKNAVIGTRVQKYGRTTGYTKGTVTAVNVTAIIGYDTGPARFVRQIEFTGSNGAIFGDHGDSGSLIVTEERFPIALLFAGDDVTHVVLGNPIQDILDYFGMEFDESNDEDIPPPGKIGSARPR